MIYIVIIMMITQSFFYLSLPSLLFLFISSFILFPTTVSSWCLSRETIFKMPITKIDYSQDRRLFATTTSTGLVNLYDASNHLFLSQFSKASKIPIDVKFSKDKKMFGVSFDDSTIRFYSTVFPYNQIVQFSAGLGNGQVFIDFSYDSLYFLTCGAGSSLVKVWSIINPNSPSASGSTSITGPVSCRFNHNNYFGVGTLANGITYFNLAVNSQWNSGQNACYDIDFDPTGTKLIGGCSVGVNKRGISIIIATQTMSSILTATLTVRTAAYALDGNTMVFGGDQKFVHFLNSSGSQILKYQLPTSVKSCDFSSDSNYLIVGTSGGSIHQFSTSCLKCQPGYYLNITTTNCNLCSSNLRGCNICLNSSICTACVQGFYLDFVNNINNCKSCQSTLTGCGACSDELTCTYCMVGYYLHTSKTCKTCSTTLTGCFRCKSSSVCEQCIEDYYITNTYICRSCNITGACSSQSQCAYSSYCTRCSIGLYSSSPGTCSSCSTSMSNCILCSASNVCLNCNQGYRLSANKASCIACSTGCLICDGTGLCLECRNSLYLKSADNLCYLCSYPCQTCSNTGNTNCLSCVSGYFYNSALVPPICKKCNPPCSSCNSSTQCLSCSVGYYKSGTNCATCENITPFCQQCTPTVCLNCTLGYYRDSTPPTCKPCSTIMYGCLWCTSVTQCITCSPGTYLTLALNAANNSCLACPIHCSQCSSLTVCASCVTGYYLQTSGVNANKCLQCPKGCSRCLEQNLCLECQFRYFMELIGGISSGNCKLCSDIGNGGIQGCLTCFFKSSSSSLTCAQCVAGMQLDSGQCIICSVNCLRCNSSICFECEIGYFYNSGASTCEKCSQNCTQCTTSSIICTNCAIGFHFQSGTSSCQSCSELTTIQGCLVCSSDTTSLCLSCQIGYYLTPGSAPTPSICQLCVSQINYCSICQIQPTTIAALKCTKCSYGYIISVDQLTCQSCSDLFTGCLQCSSSISCLTCETGYYEDSGICFICKQGCKLCSSSSNCQICSSEFLNDNGVCTICGSILSGCQECEFNLVSTVNQCVLCSNGYYLQTSPLIQCILCRNNMKGCQFCNDSTTCTTCYYGYYLKLPSNICQECQLAIQGCEICKTNTQCLFCQSGHYLLTVSPTIKNCILCASTMYGCIKCQDQLTTLGCLVCDQGFYLDYTGTGTNYRGDCVRCNSQIIGCSSCNGDSLCLQCEAGYFLSTADNLCYPCTATGCEICYEHASNTCVNCNSRYFLDSSDPSQPICNYCSQFMQGCLQCLIEIQCTKCENGYYLNQYTNLCQLCISNLIGCSLCVYNTNSPPVLQCTGCTSMYYLKTIINSECINCQSTMVGCIYCFQETTCQGCASGFYLSPITNLCESCQTIDGCIVCSDSDTCVLCKGNFFLQQTQQICYPCSVLLGCYSCINNITCETCVGGYRIQENNKICEEIKVSGGGVQTKGMKFISEYINKTTLSHSLLPNQIKYTPKNFTSDQLTKQIKIILQNPQFVQSQLKLIGYKWISTKNQLQFYTDNPISLEEQVSINKIPRRLLSPMPAGYKTYIEIDQDIINAILPDLYMPKPLVMDYDLSEPDFYQSLLNKGENIIPILYSLFGIIAISLFTINFLIKAIKTVKNLSFQEYGQIIPHLLALKAPIFIIYPLYPEEIGFSFGFMVAEFPWGLGYFNANLADQSEYMPEQYTVLYNNMSLACTYLVPFSVFILLLFTMWLCYKSSELSEKEIENQNSNLQVSFKHLKILPESPYKSILFNFFLFGLVFNCSAALQSALWNPLSTPSISSISTIIGVILLFVLLGNSIYSTYQNSLSFYQLRIFVKAFMLSFCHYSPLYLFCGTVITDILLLFIQFKISKNNNSMNYPKIFLSTNIIASLCLIISVILSWHYVSIISIMVLVCIILFLELLKHYFEYKAQLIISRNIIKKEFNLTTDALIPGKDLSRETLEDINIWELNFGEQGNEESQEFDYDDKQIKRRKPKIKNRSQLPNQYIFRNSDDSPEIPQ